MHCINQECTEKNFKSFLNNFFQLDVTNTATVTLCDSLRFFHILKGFRFTAFLNNSMIIGNKLHFSYLLYVCVIPIQYMRQTMFMANVSWIDNIERVPFYHTSTKILDMLSHPSLHIINFVFAEIVQS